MFYKCKKEEKKKIENRQKKKTNQKVGRLMNYDSSSFFSFLNNC